MSALRVNAPRIAAQCIEGEVVAMDLKLGVYFHLQGTAAAMFEWIRQGCGSEEVVARLPQSFSDIPEDAKVHVDHFISELLRENLVVRAPERAGDGNFVLAGTGSRQAGRMSYTPPKIDRYEDLQDLLMVDPIHDSGEGGWPELAKGGDAAPS